MRPIPDPKTFEEALKYIDEHLELGKISSGAAKGILYSLIEVLGSAVGDPLLPEHLKSSYEAILELAQEVKLKNEW